jgi:glycosyltransferase involved in cell wall biosynthesis
VRSRTKIFYLGTYERDYPRNSLTIAALRRAGYVVEEIHASVWTNSADKTSLLKSPLALLRLGLRLAQAYVTLVIRFLARFSHADLVMVGYIGQLDLLVFGPLARLLRRPIIFNPLITLTDTLIDDRRTIRATGVLARGIRAVDALSLRLADAILVDTPENGAYLTRTFGVGPDRLFAVPVGADEETFALRECNGYVDIMPGITVLFYGTMIPLQGVDTIVRAAKLLQGDGETHFEIIGTGQMLASVQSLARELGVQNVDFVQRVPFAELPRRIECADVVLGIFGETEKAGRVVPNKVYQAMAMGAAIVTRDSSAQRAVLADGSSALLVPPGDPKALADAIRRLYDPALRQSLGAAARSRFCETASVDVQAAALTEAVDATLLRANRRRAGRVPA